MRIENEYENVKSSFNNTKQFSFNNSSKLFKILSDTLYSNKIGSIVRELCSNAYDSHVAAGKKDIPFKISLPTLSGKLFKPNQALSFTIEDFGVGLSEEEIFNIFCVYGQSTKTNSDDFIGAYGIGAKSPFSYTENFTLISTYNGIRTTYLAYIDSEGFPSISKLNSIEIKECNGIKISITVKKEDINQFRKEVKYQLQFYDVFPIIEEEPDFFDDVKTTTIMEGTNWKLVSLINIHNPNDKLICINENIGYYVDLEKHFQHFSKFLSHLNYSLVIKFNIGELDLIASRENIAFTEKTISVLKNVLYIFIDELKQILIDKKNKNPIWKYINLCICLFNMRFSSCYSENQKIQELYSYINNICFNFTDFKSSYTDIKISYAQITNIYSAEKRFTFYNIFDDKFYIEYRQHNIRNFDYESFDFSFKNEKECKFFQKDKFVNVYVVTSKHTQKSINVILESLNSDRSCFVIDISMKNDNDKNHYLNDFKEIFGEFLFNLDEKFANDFSILEKKIKTEKVRYIYRINLNFCNPQKIDLSCVIDNMTENDFYIVVDDLKKLQFIYKKNIYNSTTDQIFINMISDLYKNKIIHENANFYFIPQSISKYLSKNNVKMSNGIDEFSLCISKLYNNYFSNSIKIINRNNLAGKFVDKYNVSLKFNIFNNLFELGKNDKDIKNTEIIRVSKILHYSMNKYNGNYIQYMLNFCDNRDEEIEKINKNTEDVYNDILNIYNKFYMLQVCNGYDMTEKNFHIFKKYILDGENKND